MYRILQEQTANSPESTAPLIFQEGQSKGEKETAQRTEVTELKNQFRGLKANANNSQSQLSYLWPTIENNITDTEKMFSAFEEWMYINIWLAG